MMKTFLRHKYLFDQGVSLLSQGVSLFNTSLLIILAGDKIKRFTGINRIGVIIFIGISLYLFANWALGWTLDRFGYFEKWNDEINKRNYAFMETRKAFEKQAWEKK